jgi:nucleoside-diphosphate-sugar epimerase
VPALLQAGHDVTAVVRSMARARSFALRGAVVREVDLFEPDSLPAALEGHDAVINLATHIPHMSMGMLAPSAWRENDRLRQIASANLVDAALATGVRRFVQESFAPIYQDKGDEWIDERDPVSPNRYNRSVVDAERSASRFTERGGTGVILRFAAFYGPDAEQTKAMVTAVRYGWMPLLGPEYSYYSSVSHDDAAAAAVAALEVPAGIYNVGDDEPMRHRRLANTLAEALGVPSPRLPPAWTARLAGSFGQMLARSLRISNRKLRGASGWIPRYPTVREGFEAVAGVLPPSGPTTPRAVTPSMADQAFP